MPKILTSIALMAVLLSACGEEPQRPPDDGPPSNATERVFKPYEDALERAKGVETMLQQGDDRRRRALGDN